MSITRNVHGPTADSLDLHGITVDEALEHFVEQYNLRVKGGHLGGWTIVHGYGSSGKGGAIRSKRAVSITDPRIFSAFALKANINWDTPDDFNPSIRPGASSARNPPSTCANWALKIAHATGA